MTASPSGQYRHGMGLDWASRSVTRGGLINAAGDLLSITNGLFLALIARLLGADILGAYVLAETSVSLLLRVGLLGLDKGMLRHVPKALESDQPQLELRRVLGTGLRVGAVVSVLTVAAVLLLQLLATPDGPQAHGDRAYWLSLMILALPGRFLSDLLLTAVRGNSRMAEFVVVRGVVSPAILMGTAVLGIALGAGSNALIIAYLSSTYVGAALSWCLAKRRLAGALDLATFAAPMERDLLRFSVPQGASDLLNLALARVDILMIGYFLPDQPELVAFYALAAMLSSNVKKVRIAFDTALSPIMARLMARGDHAGLRDIYQRTSSLVLLLYVPLAGCLSLAAPLILAVAGAQFTDHWLLVPMLVMGRYFNAAAGPAQSALLMSGRSRLELLNNVSISIANVALNALLIPAYGLYGAALATACSLTCFNLLRAFQVHRLLRIGPSASDVLRISLAGAIATLPAVALALTSSYDLASSALAATLFIAGYLLTIRLLGLWPQLRATWMILKGRKKRDNGSIGETASGNVRERPAC